MGISHTELRKDQWDQGRRRIFTVRTRLGHRVFLAHDRWRQIIRFKHPVLAGEESATEPDVLLHDVPTEQVYLCVVTASADAEERFVVTAYFTKNIKPGTERWRS